MTTRRGHGEGSIYKRSDGKWVGALNLGWRDGRRQRKTIYGRTRREVQDKVTKLNHDHSRGLPITDDRRPVADFLRVWLDEVVEPTTRPRTSESYRNTVENHLIPALGTLPLSRLRPAHVQRMLRNGLDAGLSPRTVQYNWQVLRRALKVAVGWGLLVRNVTDAVTPPRPQHTEVSPLAISEVRQVLAAANLHRVGAAFVLAVTCGLRRGEILGLRWIDLDPEAGRLRVTGALQRIGGELVRTEPKSERSRRSIALPGAATDALRRRRAIQAEERLAAGPEWTDTGFVFTTEIGKPMDPRNFLRQWHRLLRSVDLPERPLHDARHGAASLMLSEGVPLHVVQATLGHSTIRLTADLYGHLMPGDEERAAEAIDRALG